MWLARIKKIIQLGKPESMLFTKNAKIKNVQETFIVTIKNAKEVCRAIIRVSERLDSCRSAEYAGTTEVYLNRNPSSILQS